MDTQNRFMNMRFEGFWADTFWSYEFKTNGQFVFKSEGHYGNVTDLGFYLIEDSLLLLNPGTDWHVLAGVLKTRLKIVDNNCIRDFDNNYYCSKLNLIDVLNEKEWTFQDKVIDIIDTLQIVDAEKQRIASHHEDREQLDFEITYDGIVVVDNIEFHKFNLTRFDFKEGQLSYLTFLATKKPFEIFHHNSAGNKLNVIYKE